MVSALSLSYSTPRYVSFNLALVAGSGDPVRQYANEQKYDLNILRQDSQAGSRGPMIKLWNCLSEAGIGPGNEPRAVR